MAESNFRRKGFIWLTFPDHSPNMREARTGAPGRKLEAETEAEPIEECCLLACSPWLVGPAFLYKAEPLAQECITCTGLDHPTSGSDRDKTPTDLPTGQSHGGNFLIDKSRLYQADKNQPAQGPNRK